MNRPQEFDCAVVGMQTQLRAFAMSLTRNRDKADDLVQDTVLQALRFHASYRHDTNLGGWLRTMMRNIHYTQFRKGLRLTEDPDGKLALGLEVPADQEPLVELSHVMRAMERMKPEHIQVILSSADGATYEEMMQAEGVALGTIRSRLNRAREKLAEMVA